LFVFQKIGLLYSRVGAGAGAEAGAGAAKNVYPEPHKNDAAPQHWNIFTLGDRKKFACAGSIE
jgi:hypothetical protein